MIIQTVDPTPHPLRYTVPCDMAHLAKLRTAKLDKEYAELVAEYFAAKRAAKALAGVTR